MNNNIVNQANVIDSVDVKVDIPKNDKQKEVIELEMIKQRLEKVK